MSTQLIALLGIRTKIQLGATEVTAKPLNLRDIAELEGIYLRLFPGDESPSLSPEWNRKFFAHPEGAAAILRCCGRKDHPELESDPALADLLIDEMTLTQWKELISAAFRDSPDPKATG